MSFNQTQKPTSATKANSKNNGNKGSNMPWQFSMLQALGDLIAASTPPVGGLATEATAINILNAIMASHQDIEILLVQDTGNNNLVVQQIADYQSGVPVYSYKDVNGAPYVPVGPLLYLDPSGVLNLMLTEILAQGLTLDSMDGLLTTIDTVLDNIKLDTANLDVALSTVARDATVVSTNALLVTIDAVLDTIKTDTGLMVTDLAAIEVLITTTNGLLTTIDAVLDAIKLDTANLDVALSTRLNTFGQKASAASAPVVLSTEQEAILDAIKTATEAMNIDLDGISTEVTLAALLLAFNNEDFATQTTLEALVTAFNAEDFATQTTLLTRASEATLLTIDTVLDTIKVDTGAMVVDLAAIEALLTLIELDTGNILTDTTAIAADSAAIKTATEGINTKLTTVVRTPGMLRVVAAGAASVTAGKRSVSVYNYGNAAATWLGQPILRGERLSWNAGAEEDTLGAFAYNADTSSLLITWTV